MPSTDGYGCPDYLLAGLPTTFYPMGKTSWVNLYNPQIKLIIVLKTF